MVGAAVVTPARAAANHPVGDAGGVVEVGRAEGVGSSQLSMLRDCRRVDIDVRVDVVLLASG